MLTQEYVGSIDEIVIDQEWEGKQGLIKSYLYNFYQQNLFLDQDKYPELSVQEVHSVIDGTPKCHELAYKVREGTEEPLTESDFSFLKGMVLPNAGKGRST